MAVVEGKMFGGFRGYKNLPVISRRLKAHRIRRAISLILLVGLSVGLVYFLVTGRLGSSSARASLEADGALQVDNNISFDQNSEPTFTLDTAGRVVSDKKEISLGKLETGGSSIESKLSINNKESDIVPEISTTDSSDQYVVKIKNQQRFKPGKYQLKVDLSGEGRTQTLTQDFTWGVLAINFDKSSYKIGETANIGMAVLSDSGKTLCDAKVSLIITAPDGQTTELSTDNKTITISNFCANANVTNIPDYQAIYTPKVDGIYSVELKAETANGPRNMTESFEVIENPDFVINRFDTAMRIMTTSIYAVNVNISANKDLNGGIKEKVPASFGIENIKYRIENSEYRIEGEEGTGRVDESDGNKTINWDVNLKAGETAILSYAYDAPDISPEFYLLGPIEIWQATLDDPEQGDSPPSGTVPGASQVNQTTIFTEPRAWQIASDYTCTVAAVTGAKNWNDATLWAGSCNSSYPGASVTNDVVSITAAQAVQITVNVTVTVASITYPSGTIAQIITVGSGYTLTVSGAVSITTANASVTKEMAVGAGGTLSVSGLFTLASGSTTARIAKLSIAGTGTATLSLGLTFTGSAAVFTVASGGIFNFSGTMSSGWYATSSSINVGSTTNLTAATLSGAYTFGIVNIKSGTLTTLNVSGIIFAGALTVEDGGNLRLGGYTFTASSTTNVGGGTSGILDCASAGTCTGLKTFTGLVTVYAGGKFDLTTSSTNATTLFSAGITQNSNTIMKTGTGAAQLVGNINVGTGGTGGITFGGALTINSGTTNNNYTAGEVTVTDTLTCTGGWVQTNGSKLTLGATTPVTTVANFSASTATNTVTFTNTATIPIPGAGTASTYSNVVVNGGVLSSATITIGGTLTVTSGTFRLVSSTVTVTGATSVTGTIDTLTSATGTKAFNGKVTVNASGTFNATGVDPVVTFGAGIQNDSANLFNAGSNNANTLIGDISGSGAGGFIFEGNLTIPSSTTNNTYAGAGTVTVTGILTFTGGWTQGASSKLSYGSTTILGNSGAGAFDASTNANTVTYNVVGGGQSVLGTTYRTLILSNTGGTDTASAIISVGDGLTTTSGGTLAMGTYQLQGAFTATNNGTITTSSTADPAIPTGKTWTGTTGLVQFAKTDGGQYVPAGTYGTLTFSNSSNTDTARGIISVGTSLVTTASGFVNMDTYQLQGAFTPTNGGTLQTSATADPAIPTGKTWAGTVQFAATGGGQYAPAGAYGILTFSNSSNTDTAKGAITATTLNTTASGILDMVTYTLGVTTTPVNNLGTINTQCVTSPPITASKSWGGTVGYNSTAAAQSVAGGTYNNLTIADTGYTATLVGNVIVSTALTITSGTLQLNSSDFTVSGTSSITGTIDDSNSGSGTNRFDGLITVQATTGNWTSTGNSAYEIRGGIRNYNTFTGGTGTYTFTTASQDINGDQPISFGGPVTITGAINVSNKNTSTVTITGALDGSVSGSTWINTANSTLYYASTTAIFATAGTLTATANPNTVRYSASGGGQTVKSTTYDTLYLANSSNTNTAGNTVTVNTGLTTTAGGTFDMSTYQLLGAFTPANGGTIRTQNTAAAPIPASLTWAGTVQYDSAAGGQTVAAGIYNNLIIAKTAQTATLGGAIVCNGDLTITSGILDTTGATTLLPLPAIGQILAHLPPMAVRSSLIKAQAPKP